MNYVTLEQFRSAAQLGDLAVDVPATVAIESAEEAIEAYCGRRFWVDPADAPTVRYFTPALGSWTPVDDLVSVTTLKTDEDASGTFETTWDASDYVLGPYNAQADGKPYLRIEAAAWGTRRFPTRQRSIRVEGRFGWPAVPDRVTQATILQATQLLKRTRSAPFGIETVGVDGTPVRIRAALDPQVIVLIDRLRRITP